MAFFSESVTLRGRSRFETQASDASISPGLRAESGTVQKPVDLSISTLRQCCAEATAVVHIHIIPSECLSAYHLLGTHLFKCELSSDFDFRERAMDAHDLDLGSGGLIVVPGTKTLIGGGKTGMLYAVDGNAMLATKDSGLLDSIQGFTNTDHPDWNYGCPTPNPANCHDWEAGPHLHNSPTFWNGYVFDWSEKDHLKRFSFSPPN